MKKLIAIMSLASGAGFCGCAKIEPDVKRDAAWTDHGACVTTKVVEIEGHKYVLASSGYGFGIVHASSCGCGK